MTDWKCKVCDISNFDSRDNCVNCGSPKEIICKDCGAKYEYHEFMKCFICPNCTAPKLAPVLQQVFSKCSTCGGQKAPFLPTCDHCKALAELIIAENPNIKDGETLFEMVKEKNNYYEN